MDQDQQRRIVEAVVLASPEPISAARIAELLPRCNPTKVRALVKELNEGYAEAHRAFEIWEVAGGYQLRSLPEFAPYLKQIQKTRPLRLSSAALEVLSVAAYRQPVTRAEIDHIRGVDSGAVLRSLLDRQLVRIAGHREVPGRPIVYATTRRFLEVFGLSRLGDLPNLRELEDLTDAGDDLEPGEVQDASAKTEGDASGGGSAHEGDEADETKKVSASPPTDPGPAAFAPPGGVTH